MSAFIRQNHLRFLLLCCFISICAGQLNVDQSTSSLAPLFATTEVSLKDAVSLLVSSVGNASFKNIATDVIRSEVKIFGKAVQSVKRFLSDISSIGSKMNLDESSNEQQSTTALNTTSTPIPILFDGSGLTVHRQTSTPFATFWSSIASSFTLTIVTELGDRTFFIAALLSLKYPKLVVLVGTCLALVIQSVFSTAVGQLLHMLPSNATTSTFFAFPLDDYAAALLLFVFAFIHLRAAWNPESDDGDDNSCCSGKQSFVDDVYVGCEIEDKIEDPHQTPHQTPHRADRVSDSSERSGIKSPLCIFVFDPYATKKEKVFIHKSSELSTTYQKFSSQATESMISNTTTLSSTIDDTLEQPETLLVSPSLPQRNIALSNQSIGDTERRCSAQAGSLPETLIHHKNREMKEAEKATRAIELRQLGSAPPRAFEVFKETFWVIFVAELGDKSMVSTVALAAAQNPYGVFVGSSCAHCLVTSIAVLAGSLLEGFISERIANIIGAALFLAFGVMTALEGLARQGIRLWWFIGEKASALFLAYFFTMKNFAIFSTTATSTATASSF